LLQPLLLELVRCSTAVVVVVQVALVVGVVVWTVAVVVVPE
jgi:hypothetical protein